MSELEPSLDELRMAGPARWTQVVGYQAQPHQWDTVVFRADRERVITALESRFTLLVDSSPTAHAVRFRLGVRPDDGAAPMP